MPDSDSFANLAQLLGDTNRLRVWWRSAEEWRVDRIRSTEPDPELAPTATWTYDNNYTGWHALLGDDIGTDKASSHTSQRSFPVDLRLRAIGAHELRHFLLMESTTSVIDGHRPNGAAYATQRGPRFRDHLGAGHRTAAQGGTGVP